MPGPSDLATLMDVLTATVLTLGTLLAIITAGLMFTQGKHGELLSELNNKSSDYLTTHIAAGTFQAMGAHLSTLREEFKGLEASASVAEEKALYARARDRASSMLADCAVLLNLKMKQSGLPAIDLLTAGMDPALFALYEVRRRGLRNDWQLLLAILRMKDELMGGRAGFARGAGPAGSLEEDLRKVLALLRFKGTLEGAPTASAERVRRAHEGLDGVFEPIARKLHEDRIAQLVPQMRQINVVRGRSFHLAVVSIATPLLLDLLILPFLDQGTAPFFRPFIFAAGLLSVLGVAALLAYIYKLLNV